MPTGSTSRWSTLGRPKYERDSAQNPPATWNWGITAMLTVLSSKPTVAAAVRSRRSRPRC